MESEKLSEQDLLVVVFDTLVLLIELLLDQIELYGVNLLDRSVNIELGVPPTSNILQHHGWRLNLTDSRQAILKTRVVAMVSLVKRWFKFVISAQNAGLICDRL